MNLNQLRRARRIVQKTRHFYLTRFWGMDIDRTASFSLSAKLDKTHPRGIHIGPESYIAFGATVMSHDMTRGLYLHTRIGKWCFIGAKSIILPGIAISDRCIVAAGSVVTRDVPARCMVAGNPARVIRENIDVGPLGRLRGADENEMRTLHAA